MRIFRLQHSILILNIIIGVGVAIMMYWVTDQGIGISSDSIIYIDTAKSLLAGNGFYPANKPLTHFPPLYPLMIAGAGFFCNGDLIQATRLLGIIFMGANIILVGIAMQLCSGKNMAAVGAIMLFFLSSVTIFEVHTWALSEPPFLTFSLTALIILAFYVLNPKLYLLIAASISIALGIITRYIGIILVPVMVLTAFIFVNRPLKDRLKNILWATIIATLPLAIWVIRNLGVAHNATNRTLAIHPPEIKKLLCLGDTLYNFILPVSFPIWARILILGIVTAYVITVAALLYNNKKINKYVNLNIIFPIILTLYSVIYILFLIVSISLFDASTPLDYRMLAPVLLIFLIIIISLSWSLSKALDKKIIWQIFLSFFIFLTILNGPRTVLRAVYIHNHGLGYNSREWRNSKIIAYLGDFMDNRKIYSNDRLSLWFFLKKDSSLIPRKISPDTLLINHTFEDNLDRMFKECRDGEAIIVYFNKIERSFLPTIDEIESRANLPILHKFEDGVVFGR
jgi:hypothetical protein